MPNEKKRMTARMWTGGIVRNYQRQAQACDLYEVKATHETVEITNKEDGDLVMRAMQWGPRGWIVRVDLNYFNHSERKMKGEETCHS